MGRSQCAVIKKPHHCVMIDSVRVGSKVIKLIKINVFKALSVSSIWLKAQNLNQVFWKLLENTSLEDSGMSVFSQFPLNLGNRQTSFDSQS